jgi:DNA-binding MarR family transcriptional regulator
LRAVSREENIDRVQIVVPKWVPEDLSFQIHLRLTPERLAQPDEVRLVEVGREGPNAIELSDLAYGIYSARRKRDRMLRGELFGEPAWDMLLALYCLPSRGEQLSVTTLNYAANVAQSTGYRVQNALRADGLIERHCEGSDRRRQLVILTARGRTMLEGYLAWLLDNDSVGKRYLALAAA